MMISSRGSLPIAGKILGHTQASTTQRYAHLEENPARKALEIAAAKIVEAINKPGGNVIHFPKTGEAGAEPFVRNMSSLWLCTRFRYAPIRPFNPV